MNTGAPASVSSPVEREGEAKASGERAARARSAFWPALWTGVGVLAPKVWYVNAPEPVTGEGLRAWAWRVLGAVHEDLLFAAAFALAAALALRLVRGRPGAARAAYAGVVALGAAAVFYAVANLRVFEYMHAP